MPRPKPRTRTYRSELHLIAQRYFLDQISYQEGLDEFKNTEDWRDSRDFHRYFQLCWRPESCVETEETVWRRHAEELVEEFTDSHPGKRPRLWWLYNAPEPRRQLSGPSTLSWSVPAKSGVQRPTYEFGLPLIWTDNDNDPPSMFESQAAFLQRHGLLIDGERERIAAEGFGPESLVELQPA